MEEKRRKKLRKKYAQFYEDDPRFGAKHVNVDIGQYGGGGDQPLRKHFYRMFLDKIIEWIPKSAMALDVGCGQGHVLVKVAPKVKEIVGVEIAPTRIEESIQRINSYDVRNVALILCDALDLCFQDGVFDVVVVSHVIEHVIEDYGLLRECSRVLKPHGMLIIATPNALRLDNIARNPLLLLSGKFTKAVGEFPELLLECPHVRAFSYYTLEKRLDQIDFQIVDSDGIGFFLFAPECLWAKLFRLSGTLKTIALCFFTVLTQLFPRWSWALLVKAQHFPQRKVDDRYENT